MKRLKFCDNHEQLDQSRHSVLTSIAAILILSINMGNILTGGSSVETLHQLGHTLCEEALAEHEAHLGMAALA